MLRWGLTARIVRAALCCSMLAACGASTAATEEESIASLEQGVKGDAGTRKAASSQPAFGGTEGAAAADVPATGGKSSAALSPVDAEAERRAFESIVLFVKEAVRDHEELQQKGFRDPTSQTGTRLLRFPHLYLFLKNPKEYNGPKQPRILVVGVGQQRFDIGGGKTRSYHPQYAELSFLFPESYITVVDTNAEIVSEISSGQFIIPSGVYASVFERQTPMFLKAFRSQPAGKEIETTFVKIDEAPIAWDSSHRLSARADFAELALSRKRGDKGPAAEITCDNLYNIMVATFSVYYSLIEKSEEFVAKYSSAPPADRSQILRTFMDWKVDFTVGTLQMLAPGGVFIIDRGTYEVMRVGFPEYTSVKSFKDIINARLTSSTWEIGRVGEIKPLPTGEFVDALSHVAMRSIEGEAFDSAPLIVFSKIAK